MSCTGYGDAKASYWGAQVVGTYEVLYSFEKHTKYIFCFEHTAVPYAQVVMVMVMAMVMAEGGRRGRSGDNDQG